MKNELRKKRVFTYRNNIGLFANKQKYLQNILTTTTPPSAEKLFKKDRYSSTFTPPSPNLYKRRMQIAWRTIILTVSATRV